jgi:predicted aspartyl protease
MYRYLSAIGLLCIGLAGGWQLRGVMEGEHGPAPGDPLVVDGRVERTDIPVATPQPTVSSDAPVALAGEIQKPAATFRSALESGAYTEAIGLYEQALDGDEPRRAGLKRELLGYLGANAQDCSDGRFMELVDVWLDAYYADIDVLLLLADNQRYCGSPEEAARTLQLADTYSSTPGESEAVAVAVARLADSTDKYLAEQSAWIELLGFYEFLDLVDLASDQTQLRRALLYERVGEAQRGRDILLALRDSDDGLDKAWTAELEQQLAEIKPTTLVEDEPLHAIPLERRGDHFLVPATINGAEELALIIDTGASITTLSLASFRQLQRSGFQLLGTRLFNTPNGRTRGDIYLASSLRLGEHDVDGLEIAVLDFDTSGGFDGLLGMNVLRNYRFEIEQERDLLYLTPRH